jgi:hypothetical protein
MPWPLAWWQVAVLEFDAGAATVGSEPYFYGAGSGWQVVGARVAPADDQPARRVELQEAAPDRRPFDIEHKPASRLDAIATLDGLRRWWTTIVTGSAAPGGTLRFGFAGLDEQIVMRADVVRPLSAITWSCMAHTRNDEWTASTVRFGLADRGPQACELNFHHTGIRRELVAEGWEHFLASLAAYAEHGAGSPYGA